MSAFDDKEKLRQGLARFHALYAHEFTREARRGKMPSIFEDEPIVDDRPSLIELFERELKTPRARRKRDN